MQRNVRAHIHFLLAVSLVYPQAPAYADPNGSAVAVVNNLGLPSDEPPPLPGMDVSFWSQGKIERISLGAGDERISALRYTVTVPEVDANKPQNMQFELTVVPTDSERKATLAREFFIFDNRESNVKVDTFALVQEGETFEPYHTERLSKDFSDVEQLELPTLQLLEFSLKLKSVGHSMAQKVKGFVEKVKDRLNQKPKVRTVVYGGLKAIAAGTVVSSTLYLLGAPGDVNYAASSSLALVAAMGKHRWQSGELGMTSMALFRGVLVFAVMYAGFQDVTAAALVSAVTAGQISAAIQSFSQAYLKLIDYLGATYRGLSNMSAAMAYLQGYDFSVSKEFTSKDQPILLANQFIKYGALEFLILSIISSIYFGFGTPLEPTLLSAILVNLGVTVGATASQGVWDTAAATRFRLIKEKLDAAFTSLGKEHSLEEIEHLRREYNKLDRSSALIILSIAAVANFGIAMSMGGSEFGFNGSDVLAALGITGVLATLYVNNAHEKINSGLRAKMESVSVAQEKVIAGLREKQNQLKNLRNACADVLLGPIGNNRHNYTPKP